MSVGAARLWQSYIAAKVANDEGACRDAFARFVDARAESTGRIFESASYLFLEEGRQEMARGNYEAARREYLNAVELNPYLWPAFAGLAQIKKREGKYTQFLDLNFKGMREAFSLLNSFFVMDAMIWFFKNLIWIFILAFTFFSLLLFLKYMRPFYATTASYFEQKEMKPLYITLLTLFVMVLPLVLGLNFYLAAGLYLVIIFPFLDIRERYVTVALIVLSLIVPFLSLMMSNVNHARSDPLLRAHMTQFFDGDSSRRIAFLEAQPGEGEHRNLSIFTVARLHIAKKEYLKALETFDKVPASSKYRALALINIGNIQYFSQDYQQAIGSYRKALQKDADLGVALYNLSVTYAKIGRHQEAETNRADANRKEPGIITRAAFYEGEVIAAEPDFVARFLHSLSGEGNPVKKSWLSSPSFVVPALSAFAFLFLALIHLQFRNARLLARACDKCGRIFFQSDAPEGDWCSQCVSLYQQKEDLPSEAKSKKFAEVKAFNKFRHRIYLLTQFLLPGSKKIFRGEVVSGAITLFFWVFLAVHCISPLTHITYPFMKYMEGPILITWLWIGVTAVFWLIFGLRPIWKED